MLRPAIGALFFALCCLLFSFSVSSLSRFPCCAQIFQQSFIASQASKDKHWLTQSCKDADLEIDEFMEQELGGDSEGSGERCGTGAA